MMLISLLLCGCQKQYLEVPDYPLNKQTIVDTILECDFPVDVKITENEKTEIEGFQQTSYTLRLENIEISAGKCMGILTHCKDNNRGLGLNVANLDENEGLSEEECKKAIIFATRLFGGFETDTQVWDEFIDEFDANEAIKWENKIENIDCQIQYDPSATVSKLLIGFANDLSDFIYK